MAYVVTAARNFGPSETIGEADTRAEAEAIRAKHFAQVLDYNWRYEIVAAGEGEDAEGEGGEPTTEESGDTPSGQNDPT